MTMKKDNIILIGMPGSGKSTIGPLLAACLGKDFIDTDTVIKNKENRELRDIVKQDGLESFLKIQESAVLELKLRNHVVATGGSIVYNEAAMNHLKERGVVVYLELGLDEIESRLAPGRRFARQDGQSMLDLFEERIPLYRKFADITVDCSGKDKSVILDEITKRLSEYPC